MTSLALGSKLSSINARTRVAKAVANFLTGLPQKLVRTTRAGLATCIGPDGTLQWGPHNLLGESSNYETYTRTTGVSAPVSVAAPDGTPTACSITYDGSGTAGSYRFYADGPTPASGRTCLVSVWLRSATPKTMRIYTNHGGYTTCNVTSVWTRFTCNVFNGNGFAHAQLLIYSDTGDNSTFTLEVAWGMIEDVTGTNRTTPSDYVDSTVKNRLSYPNSFNNAFWSKLSSMQVYDNTCTGPTGQPAHTLVAGAASAELYQTITLSGVYTAGFKLRRRLGSGAVSIRNSANSAWIPLSLTSDWVQFQNDGGTSGGNAYCDILMATAGDQIDICDAQLNPGSTLWPYFYNAGPAPAVGAYYGQRTDYDPVTLACKGALIEPTQTTQLLANPDDLSASPWAGIGVVASDDGTKFRGRRMWKITKGSTAASENYTSGLTPSLSGNQTLRVVLLASSNSSQIGLGLYGSTTVWGLNGDTTCSIKSGPGAVAQLNGGFWLVTGLSTNVPTVVTLTRNYTTAETGRLYFYPDTNASTTAGRANYVQVDNLEAGTSPTSFIPNPATSGTVVRTADTSQINFDDLARALPWLMDSNLLANPDTPATQSITTTAQQYTVQMQGTGTCTLSGTATGVLTGTGAGNVVTMTVTATAGTLTLTFAGANTNGKINPGPVAQTYYPQASKQGTIVFEGDLVFGPASGGMSLFALENGASNRVELYKGSASNTLSGLFNVNSGSPGNIASGTIFKSLIGFSPSSAGAVLNGGAETAITPSAFSANPNVLKIGNDAVGSAASSMHIRRLRLFNTNLPSSTKQSLTR